jgi:sulfotransferase family protein
MAEPTLMYCIGATKAGTSWLHRYISNHPQCHMRGIKELHYFDAVEFDDYDPWISDVTARRDSNLAEADDFPPELAEIKRRVAQDADDWRQVLQTRGQNDSAYLEYLDKGRTDQHLVGDFTPAYGLLPERRLAHMAGMLPDVRFVYLLRDPVQRIWSHARMMAARRANKPGEIPRRSVNILKRILKGKEPEIVRRSDYIGPLARLAAVASPEQLYVGFYEELFTKRSIGKISRFLGIDHGWADFSKRFMEGPKAVMEPGQWGEMRAFLAPQYDAMAEMFGKLPDAWGRETMKV